MSERRGAARRADRRSAARADGRRAPPASAAPRKTSGPTVPLLWIVGVAAVAVAVYANSLGGALLYDDVNAIVTNALVRTADVARILTEPSWWGVSRGPLWRPLTTLTFALDHVLHGIDPFGYHLVNVGLHSLVSVAVLIVFALVTGVPRTALAAALLFAVHPIHTEAVASVVGRAELTAAAGFFVAWRCWLAADAAEAAAGTRRVPAAVWVTAAVLVYFLAMCGKENAVALPAVLLLADLVARRGDEPIGALLRRRWPRYVTLAGVALVFIVLRGAVIGQVTPGADLLDNPLGSLPAGARLMTAIKVLGLYAARLVFPYWLSADYSFDQITAVTTPLDVGFFAGVGVLIGVPALAWWSRRRLPALTLGLGMLIATFAVVANLFFLIGTIMGERLMYLPSAGFCLALAAGLAAVDARPATRWSPAFVAPLAVLVFLYGARTATRNRVWSEPITFYATMTADAPRSARSHRELAGALAAVGRFDEARRAFDRSLAIKPEDASTLYNFGNVASQQGRFDEAVELYQRALRAKPDFVAAMENLGNAESMRGNQEEALVWLRRAHELEPSSSGLAMNVANTLYRSGAIADARVAYERALDIEPTSPDILTNYGTFLYAQGDFVAAIRILERIAAPAPARALVALAASYRAQGKRAEAQSVQAGAERLYPQDPGVRQVAELLRRDAAGGGPAP